MFTVGISLCIFVSGRGQYGIPIGISRFSSISHSSVYSNGLAVSFSQLSVN